MGNFGLCAATLHNHFSSRALPAAAGLHPLRRLKNNTVTYTLTREDLASITDIELAFSTERLIPAWDDIPEDFKRGNVYTRTADALFSGTDLPSGTVEFRAGFRDDAIKNDLARCVRAHLQSFGPKHEHKIAGVGFLISRVCAIDPTPTPT